MRVFVDGREIEVVPGARLGDALGKAGASPMHGAIVGIVKGRGEKSRQTNSYWLQTSKGKLRIELVDSDLHKIWHESVEKISGSTVRWASEDGVAFGPFASNLSFARDAKEYSRWEVLLGAAGFDAANTQLIFVRRRHTAACILSFRSPVSGIVTEKKAAQGMRFMPGESLFQVTDLASVWIVADVFEQDIGLVKTGAKVRVTINAYPDKVFEGRISYVYPSLEAATRTVPVRVELANPGYLLKPAMFAQVELPVGGKAAVLTVPDSAVIDSGTRRIVLVQLAQGRFAPREVRLGARSNGYVEVLEGVAAGEPVVVAANFLIDAESNLKAALGSFEAAGETPAAPSAAMPAHQHESH